MDVGFETSLTYQTVQTSFIDHRLLLSNVLFAPKELFLRLRPVLSFEPFEVPAALFHACKLQNDLNIQTIAHGEDEVGSFLDRFCIDQRKIDDSRIRDDIRIIRI